jgi:hypothetical protein
MRIVLLSAILLSACATPLRTDAIRSAAAAIAVGKVCGPPEDSTLGKWSASLRGRKWFVHFDPPGCDGDCPMFSTDVDAASGAVGECQERVTVD